ncbi:hypothetical protein AC579_2149 [Pseudocercospora musae]|uniref:Uncharacterized protein n=1 Tax=Pseudocercospora musae TaxID=113226 RepID=A0A139IET4_9PEZI|nr:hypothetical protein AC579_2149 [Pseudocercospora musae]
MVALMPLPKLGLNMADFVGYLALAILPRYSADIAKLGAAATSVVPLAPNEERHPIEQVQVPHLPHLAARVRESIRTGGRNFLQLRLLQ